MTLDEAIKHAEEVAIDQDLCCSECAEEHRQLAEWLKDYKQLLEQQSSNDCIARQPLIDNWNCCADMLMDEGDSAIVMDWIFDAPSVTPTHKVGKWIRVGSGNLIDDFRCECCNKQPSLKKVGYTWGWDFTDYCPNCGAEMEGRKDE